MVKILLWMVGALSSDLSTSNLELTMLSKSNFFKKFSSVPPGLGSDSTDIYFSSVSMEGLEEMHQYSINEKLYEFFEFDAFKHQSETARYIEKLLQRMSGSGLDRAASYWFVRRMSDDTLVGTAGLLNLDYGRKSIEWGYGIDPDLWGNGYVLKIQEDLKTYVFETLGLNRLHGITMVNNKRTIESVLASGAKNEGISRDHYCKDGVFIDGWQYSILAKDYFAERVTSESEIKVTPKDIITVLTDLLPQESIGMGTSMENTASWDSLTHMNLMIELKERFSVDFSPLDIAQATSVESITDLLNR
jgi:RimJ/RimL family protein N-acetyltransferase/acyl carrier protein